MHGSNCARRSLSAHAHSAGSDQAANGTYVRCEPWTVMIVSGLAGAVSARPTRASAQAESTFVVEQPRKPGTWPPSDTMGGQRGEREEMLE